MANRILECADRYVERIKTQTAKGTGLSGQPIGQALIELDEGMALESWEHAQYQQHQARAHASGTLTTEEAQTIYIALGEAMSTENGGWQSHVKLPLKLAITQTMEELVRAALAK